MPCLPTNIFPHAFGGSKIHQMLPSHKLSEGMPNFLSGTKVNVFSDQKKIDKFKLIYQ